MTTSNHTLPHSGVVYTHSTPTTHRKGMSNDAMATPPPSPSVGLSATKSSRMLLRCSVPRACDIVGRWWVGGMGGRKSVGASATRARSIEESIDRSNQLAGAHPHFNVCGACMVPVLSICTRALNACGACVGLALPSCSFRSTFGCETKSCSPGSKAGGWPGGQGLKLIRSRRWRWR
jgi:hypothetical protein